MFGVFKKLFKDSGGEPGAEITFRPKDEPLPSDLDPLADAAIQEGASAEFVRLLHERGVHVVSKNAARQRASRFTTF